MKRLIIMLPIIANLLFLLPAHAENGNPKTLKDLVAEVKANAAKEAAHNKEREQQFMSDYNQQTALLKKAKAALSTQESEKDQLKSEYDANEEALAEMQKTLDQRTGDLGELFGVFRQTATDTQSAIYDSLVSAQHPERVAEIAKLAKEKKVPTIDEIKSLWMIMLGEIEGSSEISKFKAKVVKPDGEKYDADITRVGSFNLVTGDTYLKYSPSDKAIIEYTRQPSGSIRSTADDLTSAKPNSVTGFAIDPSRGVLLSLLVQAPNLVERIEQGKTVGYAIIIVGLIGLFIALYRFIAMGRVSAQMTKQQKDMDHFDVDNPLGRVLNAFYENQKLSADVISRKLDEVIFKDASSFRSGIQTIKVLAAIAPLMGLLGTVTGMIGTFQAITLFGTGDPKLMAGGISQALVTTVLGLVVSIPLLLSHSILSTRATLLTKILGEQAAGMVANQAAKLEKEKLG